MQRQPSLIVAPLSGLFSSVVREEHDERHARGTSSQRRYFAAAWRCAPRAPTRAVSLSSTCRTACRRQRGCSETACAAAGQTAAVPAEQERRDSLRRACYRIRESRMRGGRWTRAAVARNARRADGLAFHSLTTEKRLKMGICISIISIVSIWPRLRDLRAR